MKILNVLLFLFFAASVNCFGQSQGISNNWLMGYDNSGGEVKFDFFSGAPQISQYNVPMDFRHTHANVSDIGGNLLFYTNGNYIADASHDTMLNGSGLNPGAYANFTPDGLALPQASLVIPKPGSSSIYYMFHNTSDTYPSALEFRSYKFYITTVDMSLNGGLGAVISKNGVLINDTMNVGKITACKAGDGISWWVFVHKVNSNTFYRMLVTSGPILGPYAQNIGSFRPDDDGQAKFSPDGKKYAYYHHTSGLDVFDFDRCTGTFSNFVHGAALGFIGAANVGCEFSPNSKVVYVSRGLDIYQFDLTTPNINISKVQVAVWDNFQQPGVPNLGVYLSLMQLGPDGKIYISTGNSSTYLGQIENPDSVGMGCNVMQHSIVLPVYNFNTFPNHPNYFLGCDTTLSCNCIVSTNFDYQVETQNIKYFPNPTNGKFTLQFNVQSTPGIAQIYDINGKQVLSEYISPWSQYKHLDITYLPKGMYLCKLAWGSREASVKVIKE